MIEDDAVRLLEETWSLNDRLETFYYDNEYRKKKNADTRNFRASILAGKQNSRFFLEKIKELETILNEYRSEYDRILRQRANETNPHQHIVYNYLSGCWKLKVEEAEKSLRRFRFYHSVCLGHAKTQELDLINARLFPINEIIGEEPVNSTGKIWTYECPIHTEKTGSFQWYRNSNTWWCFGCQQGSDSIDLYMKINQVDFITAVKALT